MNPLAVVPIPTPVPSTANVDVPDPTKRVLSPGDVVAIPTLSNMPILSVLERLTLPNLNQSFSVV